MILSRMLIATAAAAAASLGLPLASVSRSIAAEPAVRQGFLETGARAVWSTPHEIAAFAERERVEWKEVIQLSGAKME